MNVNDIDLNLLRVFDAVLRERGVTPAASRLGLTQPAVSNALARLRALFGDALFVRTPAGMDATPFARGVAEP
ncbi:MAG TPA: LysR family transcriptional regulator, partial [Burkholderiales bacterium]